MINTKDIKALQISLASPEQIRKWSTRPGHENDPTFGEIVKSETINYKTFRPEPGGLFDEAIFGPVKDYECACGRYKKVKYRGKTCEKCGVDIVESIVRRERMGRIELVYPVTHIWMSKCLPNPSKIALVLNLSYREVEEVIYFANYIILDNAGNDIFEYKQIIDLVNPKTNLDNRRKLRKVLEEILEKLDKNSMDAIQAKEYYDRLKDTSLPFSIEEVFSFIHKHTNIEFGIGSAAIQRLLKEVDLQEENEKISQELKTTDPNSVKFKRLMNRLEIIKWFINSKIKPEWMVLTVLPVTPPDTRPIMQLDNGRTTTSDINSFYRKIIERNARLKRLMNSYAPAIILNNERRMLQEAVDALFDNTSRSKPQVSKDRHPLKSLTDKLKGKQGLFRQNLLGKRVDYSGRSVIVVGPELKMYEVGIPVVMILKLFRPFIIRELIRKYDNFNNEVQPIAANIRMAEKMILAQDDAIWPIIQKIIRNHPVLLNRAPTLHRLGVQAFEPKIIDGKAIRLHPLVTSAFNADFDGDQMAVYVPLTQESIAEARSILLASWHILGSKDSKPIITPTQDMILGVYYISTEQQDCIGQGVIFSTINEAKLAYEMKKVHLHTVVAISTNNYLDKGLPSNKLLITTIGKIIFNDVLPKTMPYVNDANDLNNVGISRLVDTATDVRQEIDQIKINSPFTKKTLQNIVNTLYEKFPVEVVSKTMDSIKDLGFEYSTWSATTISAFDLPAYKDKMSYFQTADQTAAKLKHQFEKGLLTDDERYVKTINLWSQVKDVVTKDVEKIMHAPENQDNSVVIMANSGARGNVSQFTQLLGMRGLMSKSYNYDQKTNSSIVRDTIETPIKHCFLEGLTISEYFNSSYGARKGMADTAMKTSKSGYMTRKLVDVAQEIIVTENDCGATRGLIVEALVDKRQNMVIEHLWERIANRYSFEDIIDPKTNKLIVAKNEMITIDLAKQIENAGIKQVEIRSVLHCRCKHGVCQKCFGNDLTTRSPVEIGTAIGIIAAQSIGEPGTQLTMRTFHTGGAAGEGNIAQGFERLKQLFDMIAPKPEETATISEVAGTIKDIARGDEGTTITIVSDVIKEQYTYVVSLSNVICVSVGDHVEAGDKLTEGSINIPFLLSVAGIEKVRHYLIQEVQKVYRYQGIEISDKYIEIIVRQLTNRVKVLSVGDSNFSLGEYVDINTFATEVNRLIKNKLALPTAINTVFGINNTTNKSDSFLAATSFQDTKKVLTNAAIKGEVDHLRGLKENVMLGRLLPAGTGLMSSEEIISYGDEMYRKEY